MRIFNTPAFQGEMDFQNQPGSLKAKFLTLWNNYVASCIQNAQIGNPWTNTHDSPRSLYYNPMDEPLSEPSSFNTVGIQWTVFPNRINVHFGPFFKEKFGSGAIDKLHELADIGPHVFALKYNIQLPEPFQASSRFEPGGSREWQDEYCKWSVTRDAMGNITAVDFTHENPEYWFHLWKVSPNLVLSLYQQILEHSNVQLEDLYLYDESGEPVIVRETGEPAYNPVNKWNSGCESNASFGGAVHLTCPSNSLRAEIHLAAAATILREINGKVLIDANSLILAAKQGKINRNSDSRISQYINMLIHQQDIQVTLTDPIGIYGQQPNFSMFTMPPNANYAIEDCYSIVRGLAVDPGLSYYPDNMILHSRFKIPPGANFTLSDIKISGLPIKWGSQIANTFKVQLAGTVIPSSPGQRKQILPPVGTQNPGLPHVKDVLNFPLLKAGIFNKIEACSTIGSYPVQVEQNSITTDIAILTGGGNLNTSFNLGAGISVTINSYQDMGEIGQLFVVTIQVELFVTPGEKPLIIKNNPMDTGFPVHGVLEVVPACTLAPVSLDKASPYLKFIHLKIKAC